MVQGPYGSLSGTSAIDEVLLLLLTCTVSIQYIQERRMPKAWQRAADKLKDQLGSVNGDEASTTS